MVRIAYTLGILALGMSGLVGLAAVLDWSQTEPESTEIQGCLGAVEALREGAGVSAGHSAETSPLVLQAQALARYLSPPIVAEEAAPVVSTPNSMPILPSVRPAAPSMTFRLYGTSCYPSQPGRSMALVSEVGASQGSERWVKEGSQVGHFVIHEIRGNSIVYRDGDQLREMTVEVVAGPTSIARNIHLSSRKVSAAVEDVSVTLPVPTGPNNVEISGN